MTDEAKNEPRRYWPFEIGPAEQRTAQHQREIQFLDAARREGYAPYVRGADEIGAASDERSSLIVVRGRSRWEVVLGAQDARVASAFVNDFPSASAAVLEWLRGGALAGILSRVQDHLVRMPGAAHSFVLDAVPTNPTLV